jgi:hypothetical protein
LGIYPVIPLTFALHMKTLRFYGWMALMLASFGESLATPGDSTIASMQEDWRARVRFNEHSFLDINMYIQWWNVVTLDYAGLDTDPRLDVFVRRGRLGTSGRVAGKLFYSAQFAYDGVGKDSLSASAGVPNAEDNKTFFPRDVFFTYNFSRLANLTVGYFRPRAGKESIYSSAFVISQEKSWASFQPRIHMVGRGIGRETGINLGGIADLSGTSMLYDVGIFDTNHPLVAGNNTIWSPLLTGRVVWMIGDPEMVQYNTTYSQSGYGERKGLSLGINATWQARSEVFRNNSVMGVDAQLNYGPLDLLFEYNWLYRESPTAEGRLSTTDRLLTLKGAWNFRLSNGTIVQAVAMYSDEQVDRLFALAHENPFTRALDQYVVEAGVNWLLNRDRLKLGLHYFYGNRPLFGSDSGYSYVNTSLQFMM